jgi:prepilin-type N-terminal cleavage/methylation domain-containing protein
MIKHKRQKNLKLSPFVRCRQSVPARGFTIAELVITIVLMGIIIPAIALALTNLSVVNYQARDLALANMITQNKVETLRSAGYNSVSIGTVNFTAELPASMGKQRTASYSVSTPQTGIKQVDINISYTEYKSTKNLAFRTYISELGVGQ